MNLGGASDGELDFLPLMQGMMQNLLSKDILYPALKDLREKVFSTLAENDGCNGTPTNILITHNKSA